MALDTERDVSVFEEALDGLGQLAVDRHRIDARHQTHDALPLGHPALLRVHHRDHPFKVRRRAVGHALPVVGHLQELAVLAARVVELREGLDQRAGHARAQLSECVGDVRVRERLVHLLLIFIPRHRLLPCSSALSPGASSVELPTAPALSLLLSTILASADCTVNLL